MLGLDPSIATIEAAYSLFNYNCMFAFDIRGDLRIKSEDDKMSENNTFYH